MRELQARVAKWHRKTFGSTTADLLRRMGQKFDEEVDEYREHLDLKEAADVILVLMTIADRAGVDLQALVEEKLAIIEQRTDQIERDAERGIVSDSADLV